MQSGYGQMQSMGQGLMDANSSINQQQQQMIRNQSADQLAMQHMLARRQAAAMGQDSGITAAQNRATQGRMAQGAMQQTERNLQRLNTLFNDHVDIMREEQLEEGTLDYKGLDTAVRLHKEIRDSLSDIGEYLERVEAIGGNEQVNVLTVIQAHFSEKSPDEWRVLRKALADAGVLDEQ